MSTSRCKILTFSNDLILLDQVVDIEFSTLAYVSVQLVMPVAIMGRLIMPRVDLTREQLIKSVTFCLAVAFDVIELQDYIHHESLRNYVWVSYVILAFSSLSILQLVQLTEFFAPPIDGSESSRFEKAAIVYNTVCQEIPFLAIRVSAFIILQRVDITQLIFPLKNAFSICLNISRIFAKKERDSGVTQSSPDRTTERRRCVRKHRKQVCGMFFSLLLLMGHLGLLTWRVVVVLDDLRFSLLIVVVVALTVITIVRAQTVLKSGNDDKKCLVW